MHNQLRRILPTVAVFAGLAALVLLVFLSRHMQSELMTNDSARQSVEETLAQLQAMRPASSQDLAFREAVKQALDAPYVATVWLVGPDGRDLYSAGSTATSTASQDRVQELATNEMLRTIEALDEMDTSDEQRLLLLTVSAIRREGEHNDIYRHLVRRVQTQDNSTVALIGIAYDFAGWVPGLGWKLAVLGLALSLALYWLSLPLWVFLDARDRRDRACAWAMFVLIGNVVALIGYLLAVKHTAPD